MAVKRDGDGRRYVEAEVEVPGSPEEVLRALATGDGISSWFVPSKVEECGWCTGGSPIPLHIDKEQGRFASMPGTPELSGVVER